MDTRRLHGVAIKYSTTFRTPKKRPVRPEIHTFYGLINLIMAIGHNLSPLHSVPI